MIINIGDDILRLHRLGLLDIILEDKTTKRNIMWATDAYAERGELFERNAEITPGLVTGDNAGLIKTRARKAFERDNEEILLFESTTDKARERIRERLYG